MCETITHRGPDGSGLHVEPSAVLGMRRLAVVDVAGGDRPVYSEDGTVVAVFNGEIYNFAELRAELLGRGHSMAASGDSECLVHLYEEHGDAFVHRLRGMFAFALWDGRRRRLLLARDRVGKKPLYWGMRSGSLRFASKLKALIGDPRWRGEVDPVALHHYLTFQYVPAPWSIFEGIGKLPLGSTLVWQDGQVRVDRYWRLDATPRLGSVVAAEEAERLRELLLEATRLRMIGERPIGAFLSGGVDSSAVVAAMARQSPQPVRTFCVGFEETGFDEREHARQVAARYGADHSELDVLPTLAWHFDEPFAGCDLTRVMDVDVNTYLPGDLLVKVDISTMANSLEARSPFLDHVLMEWAAGLPGELKIRRGTSKYLLKRALADWLPAHLLQRRKMGFGVPLTSWLRTGLRPLAHDLLTDATARDRGIFDP
ncbi:asparagine synthase (glutamine-hydrolyzing), partial [Streptosporangium sp. NPDC001682]